MSVLVVFLIPGCGDFFTTGSGIVSITVSPASRLSATGQTVNFTASGTTANGTTQDVTSTAKWSSSNTSVATIASGGVATTVGAGTTTITATQDAGTGTASLIVTASQLQSLAISPTNPTVLQTQLSQQFTATGTFADGSTQDLTTQVLWTSSNSGVATISNTGQATLVAAGTTTITASVTTTSGAVTASTTLTVQ